MVGITFAELVSNNPGVRRFQIDIDQPVDHNNPNGQWFTQRMYLHHVDEAQPMILWPDGYSVSQWNRSEWAKDRGKSAVIFPVVLGLGYDFSREYC